MGSTSVLKPQFVLVCHTSTFWVPDRITLLEAARAHEQKEASFPGQSTDWPCRDFWGPFLWAQPGPCCRVASSLAPGGDSDSSSCQQSRARQERTPEGRGRLCILTCPLQLAQLCPPACNPMVCSTQGFPVCHQLLEFTQSCPWSQ